jgi:hypothetical protein
MAIEYFTQTLQTGVRQGQIPGKTQESRDWFRNTAKKLKGVTEGQLLQSKDAITNRIEIGKMYMFSYDPKLKKELPYYDAFPLVFPFQSTPDGFIGINLHYLPYVLRAKLMDALYNFVSDPKLNARARLKISYNILKSASTNKYIQPCIKRYLSSHLRSQFINIIPKEWDVALFLPVENFKKATNAKVWRDSRKNIG